MPIDRSSDSLSRCDPSLYSSLYDVRKRTDIRPPSEVSKKEGVKVGSKDSIEASFSKEHLKKEAVNRLRQPAKYLISQQGFMRVGKYLFLSLTLPPYLLLYGLPKWVIVEALPMLLSPLIQGVKMLGAKLKKPVEAAQKKGIQLIQSVQQVAIGLFQPVFRLISEMRQAFRRFQTRVNLYLEGGRKKIRSALLFPGVKIQEGMKFIQKKGRTWAKNIGRSAQVLAESVQGSLQGIKEISLQFLGWGQTQLHRLKDTPLRWKKSLGERLDRSQHLTEQAMGWMAKQSRQLIQKIVIPIQPFIRFYREKWRPRWEQFKHGCGKKWKEGRHAFQEKHQKMLQRLQKRQEKLRTLSYVQAIEHLFSMRWFNRLPKLLQEKLKKWFFHPFMQGLGCRLISSYSYLAAHVFAFPSYCASVALRVIQFFSKSLQSFKQFLKLGGQKGGAFIYLGRQKGGRFAWFSLYYFLLSLTMGGVLFASAIESAKEITLSLISKFSFHRRKKP